MKKPTICAANERMKREYLSYLNEARGKSDATVDQIAAAIDLFQAFTAHRDFKTFKPAHAADFKKSLIETPSEITGKPRALSPISSILRSLRDFFIWLADRPGYRSKLRYQDADYFRLTARDERIARTVRQAPAPSLEEITRTIAAMPDRTDIEKRDRALIAFTLIVGARISALKTLKLAHVDLERGRVIQDPRDVETKNGKRILTPFYPICDEAREIVTDWVTHLRDTLKWPDTAPLFPRVCITRRDSRFNTDGLETVHYASNGPIREIFACAFEKAGIPNYNPHSFRKLIATIGASRGLNAAELKAWSMGLGHEHLGTMMQSYVTISASDQEALMRQIAETPAPEAEEAAVAAFRAVLRQNKRIIA